MTNGDYPTHSASGGSDQPFSDGKAAKRTDNTGLILCGGAGSRMGGADKGLLVYDGYAAAARSAALLRGLCSTCLLSANRNLQTYRNLRLGAVVEDLRDGFQGPLAGIEAAAEKVKGDFLFVLPCDVPLLAATVPQKLFEALRVRSDLDVVYATTGERNHYLCAVLRQRCLDGAGRQLDANRHAVRDWYATLASEGLMFTGALATGFRNYNELQR